MLKIKFRLSPSGTAQNERKLFISFTLAIQENFNLVLSSADLISAVNKLKILCHKSHNTVSIITISALRIKVRIEGKLFAEILFTLKYHIILQLHPLVLQFFVLVPLSMRSYVELKSFRILIKYFINKSILYITYFLNSSRLIVGISAISIYFLLKLYVFFTIYVQNRFVSSVKFLSFSSFVSFNDVVYSLNVFSSNFSNNSFKISFKNFSKYYKILYDVFIPL